MDQPFRAKRSAKPARRNAARPQASFGLCLLIVYELPTRIGIIHFHFPRDRICSSPEIFLKGLSLLVDDESHHTRITVIRGPCNQSEPGDHISIDYVTVGSTSRVFTLASKNFE